MPSWSSPATSSRQATLTEVQAAVRRHPVEAAAGAAAGAPAAGASPPRSPSTPTGPSGTLMIAMRTPGPTSAGLSGARSARGRAEQPPLRSLRPGAAGQGDRRGVLARSAAAGRPRLRSAFLHHAATIRRQLETRGARHPRHAWRATACRRSWWRPPSCRSAAPRNFSATPSRSWPRSGRTRWRCTACSSPDEDLERIEQVTRRGRQSRGAQVSRSRSRRHRRDAAARLGRAGGRAAAVSAARSPSRSAKPTRRRCRTGREKALQRLDVPASTLHPIVSTLPNGLTLIVQPEDVSDTVSVFGHIRNRPETAGAAGQGRRGAGARSRCSPTAASISTASPSSRRSMRSAPASRPARISPCRRWREHFDRARGAAGRQ